MGSVTVTPNANGSTTAIAGSPTTGFTYFNNGRLNAVTSGGTTVLNYLYDGFGRKVVGTDTNQRFYQYDQASNMIEMTDDVDSVKLDYIFLNGLPVATFVPGGTTGTLSFLYTDRLGAPRRATSSTQAIGWTGEYQPFGGGTFTPSTIANNLRLPGQQFEQATNQDYNLNRDYFPGWSRYVESDPIGVAGINIWGGTTNTYSYAANNPGKNVDPTGLASQDVSSTPSSSDTGFAAWFSKALNDLVNAGSWTNHDREGANEIMAGENGATGYRISAGARQQENEENLENLTTYSVNGVSGTGTSIPKTVADAAFSAESGVIPKICQWLGVGQTVPSPPTVWNPNWQSKPPAPQSQRSMQPVSSPSDQ